MQREDIRDTAATGADASARTTDGWLPAGREGSRAKFRRLVEERRIEIACCASRVLSHFITDVEAGKVHFADARVGEFETAPLLWSPPLTWLDAPRASLRALAGWTRMTAGWNGCLQCGVWLQPSPVDEDAAEAAERCPHRSRPPGGAAPPPLRRLRMTPDGAE